MSEPCRENLPLLCDDYSDEDFRINTSSPKFQGLFRHSATSGRAKSSAKGAAAILTRWPEHFSSLLKYWWIGFGMITFTFFVLYNSIVAISMLPETHRTPVKINDIENLTQNVSLENSKINVYMHIFVNSNKETNLKHYLPHIVRFSKKYLNLNHNIIILLKDEPNDEVYNSDELNIEMAWNSLWMTDKKEEIVNLSDNANIRIVSLKEYMNNSPLKMYWRRLPEKFCGFLARCVAIWDKGGVAFDPIILSPSSPNPGHRESLKHILDNLKSGSLVKPTEKSVSMQKKKINNIQDIIDNMEYQDKNIMQENLLEAETRNDIVVNKNVQINKLKRNADNFRKKYLKNTNKNKTKSFEDSVQINKIVKNSEILSEGSSFNNLSTSKKIVNQINDTITTTKHNILPMFLEYLFKSPQNTPKNIMQISILNDTSTATASPPPANSALNDVVFQDQLNNSKRKSMSESKMLIKKYINLDDNSHENEKNILLSINLKGNIIATETPCHAFIGTVFSNALEHSDDESITDFIITELLIFCKGVLSSCKGVDVILI